jgi:tetratricopeptide (TPR) repeat protein
MALVYAYLPVAALVQHDHHWEDSSTLSGLMRLFLRAKYGTFQLAPGDGKPVTPPEQAASYFGALTTQYLWPGFVLGLVGLAALWKRDRTALLHSGGGFLFGVLFVLTANIDPRPTAYDAATLERFYQLPNFFFLLWIGAGLGAAEGWLEGIRPALSPPIRSAHAALLLLALPATLLAVNYGKANLRGNLLYPRFMTNIFDSLPQNAVFFVWTDTVGMGADYLTDIEKRRPDVAVIKVGILGAEPYRSTVRQKYPHLRWPDLAPDVPFSLGQFVQHNIDRYRIFVDGLPMKLSFPVIRYGLIYEVRPQGSVPRVAEVLDLNEELWKRFDLRQVDTSLYPANSMCYSVVVFYYLYHRFTMASECNYFGRYADALRHLDACEKMDPRGYVARSAPWQRQMAIAHIGLNQLDQALAHLELARKEAPSEAETYRLLSLACRKKGDQAKADYYLDEYEIRRRAEQQEPRKERKTP